MHVEQDWLLKKVGIQQIKVWQLEEGLVECRTTLEGMAEQLAEVEARLKALNPEAETQEECDPQS